MICQNEADLKKQISLYGVPAVTLLGGNEPALISTWQKKILDMLRKSGAEIEKLNAQTLDVDDLCGNAMLVPMLGGARVFFVDGLETAALKTSDAESLLGLVEDFPQGNFILITLAPGALDGPKGKKTSFDTASGLAKKLIAAAGKSGIAACLDRRTAAQNRTAVIAQCKRLGCEMEDGAAAALCARCGDDLGVLLHECEKLSVYCAGRPITVRDVGTVCPYVPDGDMYAIARHMLDGDAAKALGEISDLLAKKTEPTGIISNLGIEFSTLARASAARAAGKTADELAKDLHFRFAWKAQNALRDCRRFTARQLDEVCAVFCDAEALCKSSPTDTRALLETSVIRAMSILRKGAR